MGTPGNTKIALYLYLFQEIILGILFGIVYGSLLEYLTIIKTDHIKTWYDVTCAAFFLSSLLIGPLIGRWIDKTKKSVTSLIACNFIVFSGAFIYCIPYSPWFLLVGRFLLGFVYVGRSLVIANLSDIFDENLLSGKLAFIFVGTSIGDFLGPVINILIRDVHFKMFGINFSYVSVPLLLIMVCTFLQNIALYFSLVYPRKQFTDDIILEIEDKALVSKTKHTIQRCFNPYILLLVIIAGYGGFTVSLFSQIAPLVVKNLQYPSVYSNLYLSTWSVLHVGVSSLISKMTLSKKENFYGCVLMMLTTVMVNIGYFLSSKVLEDSYNIFLLCLDCILFAISCATFMVFPIALLQTIAEPSHRAFIESIRMSMDLFGRTVAGFSTSYIFDYMRYFLILDIFIVFLFNYFLFKSKKVFHK